MIVCNECGGSNIAEGHIAMYDPNKFNDHDYDIPIAGGLDYPLEYTWCYDCNMEQVDFIDESEYVSLAGE